MPTEPIDFECVDCCEDKTEPAYRPNSQDAEPAWYICKECALEKILDMFRAGLKAETECPPRIGGMDISIDDFGDIFPAELVEAWPERLREVGTPPRERVYYEKCEGFLGATGSDEALHCQKCDQTASGPSNKPGGDTGDDPFKDMNLGKDYQIVSWIELEAEPCEADSDPDSVRAAERRTSSWMGKCESGEC